MNFASPFIYNNALEQEHAYESVSDDEFEEGIEFSSDSGDDNDEDMDSLNRQLEPSVVRARMEAESQAKGGAESASGLPSGSLPGAQITVNINMSEPLPRKTRKGTMHHWKTGCKYRSRSADNKKTDESNQSGQPKKRRVFRRADSNIVSLNFDTLRKPSTMYAGDVTSCSRCEAILSHVSNLSADGPDQVWKCEFCGNRNVVDVDEEEKPKTDDVTFLLEPALATAASGTSGRDESIVIFCIDISGSMTVTTEVAGSMKIRGSPSLRQLRRESSMDGNQRLPSETRNVTHISRLQAVQGAVDHQLSEMAKEFPDRHVGLVAFSSEVVVIGDGTGEVVTISGEKLLNKEALYKVGAEVQTPKAIKEVKASLAEKVFELEESGSTALGPAIIVALSMASKRPGSRIILCTDGKSNEGVGKVENLKETDPDPELFYEEIASSAAAKGVSVSVITIIGTECTLIHLGKLAANTGGQVNTVDPSKLTEEFSNVLADRVIATSVVATFIVHKDLYIGSEDNGESKEKREFGSVKADTEISFEFGVRKSRTDADKSKPSSLDLIAEVPATMEEDAATSAECAKDATSSTEHAKDAAASAEHAKDTTSSAPSNPNLSTSNAGEGDSSEPQPEGAGSAEGGAEGASGEGDVFEDIPPELPFQLQISYTDCDGTKALRVLTQKKPVTKERKVAEKDIDFNVIGLHAERKSSALALEGDYSGSRGVALMNHRLAWRSSQSGNRKLLKKLHAETFAGVKSVENSVSLRQSRELSVRGRTYSDDESGNEETEEDATFAQHAPLLRKGVRQGLARYGKKGARNMEMDDEFAVQLYKSHSVSSSYQSKDATE